MKAVYSRAAHEGGASPVYLGLVWTAALKVGTTATVEHSVFFSEDSLFKTTYK